MRLEPRDQAAGPEGSILLSGGSESRERHARCWPWHAGIARDERGQQALEVIQSLGRDQRDSFHLTVIKGDTFFVPEGEKFYMTDAFTDRAVEYIDKFARIPGSLLSVSRVHGAALAAARLAGRHCQVPRKIPRWLGPDAPGAPRAAGSHGTTQRRSTDGPGNRTGAAPGAADRLGGQHADRVPGRQRRLSRREDCR